MNKEGKQLMNPNFKITISNDIKERLPHFGVIPLSMDVVVKSSDEIKPEIEAYATKIKEEYSLEDILNIPLIKEARDGYKALGKDPSRYRLACESLLRRIVKDKGLYYINNVVDAGNLLSLRLFRSTAILDFDKIVGNVNIRVGKENDIYYGIGRGLLNVCNIPLYCDEISPFGSPTSDTERTMITNNTQRILVMIILFSDSDREALSLEAKALFKKYADAQNIKEIKVIEREDSNE